MSVSPQLNPTTDNLLPRQENNAYHNKTGRHPFHFNRLTAAVPRMLLREIQVESYAGSKADETPRRFCHERIWIEVAEVIDRWHQVSSLPEWPRADYFKIADPSGRWFLLKHDLEEDHWYLGRQW